MRQSTAATNQFSLKSRYIFGTAFALLVFALVVYPGYALGDSDRSRILAKISVAGIPLSGLNRQEAGDKLNAAMEAEINNHRLILEHAGREWSYSYKELGIRPETEKAVERALAVGHGWNPIDRYRTYKRLGQQGLDLTIQYTVDSAKTGTVMNVLKKEADRKPVDARLVFDNSGALVVKPYIPGFSVDMDQLREQVEKINIFEDTLIKLPGDVVLPARKTEDVENMKPMGIMTATTTKFNPGVANRVNNIAVAAKAVSNTLIAPGEEFSFNGVVGPRTADRGFLNANVIVGGKFVLDVGGGICQVSSTLYNSVVKSGLTVTERAPHSLPVAYLPKGADATVSFGARDFRFRNNTGRYLLLKAYTGRDILTVEIYGDAGRNNGKQIRLVSEQISRTPFKTVWVNDPSMPAGKTKTDQPGSDGYVVRVYKLTTYPDGTTKKEFVNQSRYRPHNRVILVGTKAS